MRELDERFGFSELIARHLTDSRQRKNTQLPLADLLRQSVYSRIAGYEDVNGAVRLAQDPTFRPYSPPGDGCVLVSPGHVRSDPSLPRALQLALQLGQTAPARRPPAGRTAGTGRRASAPGRERTPRSAADGAAPWVWSGADGRRRGRRRAATARRRVGERRRRRRARASPTKPRARARESGGRGVTAGPIARGPDCVFGPWPQPRGR